MAPVAPRNGNGTYRRLLIWLAGFAVPLLVGYFIWLGLAVLGIQSDSRFTKSRVDDLARAVGAINTAATVAATAERDRLRLQVLELQGQQRQERETREAPGRPAPAQE